MYGGGIKHNYPRSMVKAMTYRKGGIFQHATIGGLHPWYTDNMLQLPAIEADLFNGLQAGRHRRHEVRCPLGGLSNIAYAKIHPLGGGRLQAGARHHADLLQAGTAQDRHGVRRRRRHLGRPGGAVRHGLPLHARTSTRCGSPNSTP